jgi:FMN reductase
MSVMSFANSLMLDFRCLIIPRFVYATGDSFDGDNLTDTKVSKRIEQVVADLVRVTKGVRS